MTKNNTAKASTAKIALLYTFSSVFAKGLAAISTPIFSRLMSKADFGYFNNFTSWEAILLIIITFDFTASIARAKYDYDGRMNEYISSILIASNIITLICYCIVEMNSTFFEKLFSMDIFYIRILFVYLFFFPAFNYLQTKHRIYQRYKFFVVYSIGSAILRTAVSIVLVALTENRLNGRIYGYVIPITLLNIILWASIIIKGKKISWDCVKYASIIAIPLIPHALSGILLGNSDRIMITKICGAEENAMYSLAYQISLLANILWTSMNQAWSPWLFDNINANNKRSIYKNSKIYLGIYALIIIGIYLITPEIILILGGKQYYAARFVMPPVILGCSFQFVYGMYVNLEIYAKKTATISLGTILAALLNISLNWVFIPRFGYLAAAYTTLFGYAALMLFHYIIVQKVAPDLGDLYDRKFILVLLLILTIVAFVSLLMYQVNTIRYIVLTIYSVLLVAGVVKYRIKIVELLRNKK